MEAQVKRISALQVIFILMLFEQLKRPLYMSGIFKCSVKLRLYFQCRALQRMSPPAPSLVLSTQPRVSQLPPLSTQLLTPPVRFFIAADMTGIIAV